MEYLDLEVLKTALAWRQVGHRVLLVTVVRTWGSSPRPVGSLLAIREDGQLCGSVSGGCVEDELIAQVHNNGISLRPTLVQFGVTSEQAHQFGLPCGGQLDLVLEPLTNFSWLSDVLQRIGVHEVVSRKLIMATGEVQLSEKIQQPYFDGEYCITTFGPQWRLLLTGAGQLSQMVAQMAQPLGFQVLICDPREEYVDTWQSSWGQHIPGMPDDVVVQIRPDTRTAVLALTHDPKLDDMALLEALKSDAFYVGALGSRSNNKKRRERLAMFDLSSEQINRLHGPVGLDIGSRTPAEIAVSILAELIKVRST